MQQFCTLLLEALADPRLPNLACPVARSRPSAPHSSPRRCLRSTSSLRFGAQRRGSSQQAEDSQLTPTCICLWPPPVSQGLPPRGWYPLALLTGLLLLPRSCCRDTAGQERYHSLAPMYYRGAAAAIVVFDITHPASFERAKK